MAKSNRAIPSIQQVEKTLNSEKFLPVYFLCGEDSFSLNSTLKNIEKAVEPHLTSDFDKEVLQADNCSLTEMLDIASAFPFGSDKKFIVYKGFQKPRGKKDKDILTNYFKSPAEFTILVIVHEGTMSSVSGDPYKTLVDKKFIFEAKELKGNELSRWIINYAEQNGKLLSSDNARLMVEMVGENRNLLEAQLDKLFTFLQDKKEISFDDITSLVSNLKTFTVFDLTNAIAKKDKATALKVAMTLLEQGDEPTIIVHMINRYFMGLSRVPQLSKKSDQEAARILRTHPFFYNRDYKQGRKIYSEKEIQQAAESLLKADISIKTTSADKKSVISLLIAEILSGK